MRPTVEIFIAYSGASGRVRRDAVFELLESKLAILSPDVRIRLTGDHDLRTRDLWHDELCNMLYSAHGAVLILTPETLERGYQKVEASVLSTRRALKRENLELVAVFDGVEREDVDRDPVLKWLELNRYQQVYASDHDWEHKLVSAFSDLVKAKALPTTPKQQRARWIIQKLLALQKANQVDEASLRDVAQTTLDIDDIHQGDFNDAAGKIAVALVQTHNAEQCCRTLTKLKDSHAIHDNSALRALLDLLSPGWVPEGNANKLRRIIFGEELRRYAVIGAQRELLIGLHIARAQEQSYDGRTKEIHLANPIGEDPIAEAEEHLKQELCPETLSQEDLGKLMEKFEDMRIPIIAVSKAQLSRQLVTNFKNRLPIVTLLFVVRPDGIPPWVAETASLRCAQEEEIWQAHAAISFAIR